MLLILSLSQDTVYDWYKFTGVRPLTLTSRRLQLDVETGTRFGIAFEGRRISVVHEASVATPFLVSAAEARSLLGRATPYKGVVKGKKVGNQKLNGAKLVRDPSAQQVEPEPEKAPTNAKSIMTALRKVMDNPRTLVYRGVHRDITHDDVTYMFGIKPTGDASKWEAKAEKMMVKALPNLNCEVGALYGETATLLVKVIG